VTASRRRAGRAAVAALLASVATLVLASWSWGQREGAPRADVPVSRVAAPPAPVGPVGPVGSVDRDTTTDRVPRPPPTPVELRIGGVGLRMPVVAKGVSRNGQMALPRSPEVLGWYRFGAAPGERGSTVLAGHVDTRRYGVGPLALLPRVRVGDGVRVRLSDGSAVRYRVTGLRQVDKQSRALASVFDEKGRARLRVVTCGGEFDPDRGGYQDNVVLTAVPLPGTGGQ
jgi:hypothetical protein